MLALSRPHRTPWDYTASAAE